MAELEIDFFRYNNPSVKFPLSGSIHYLPRRNNEYASYDATCFVKDGKIYHDSAYIGKVVDKKENLFFNQKHQFFNFTLHSGFLTRPDLILANQPERVQLCYGDIWLYDEILTQTGFKDVISKIAPNYNDTLNALLAFKLSENGTSFCEAQNWFEISYARLLYPKASLSSSSISNFLKIIGEEFYNMQFITLYLEYLAQDESIKSMKEYPILIDSTGVPNCVHTEKTQISNHSGKISNEIRLIYVVDRDSGLPIFYKPISGNIVDISTLKTTLNILQWYNIKVNYLILDAGYFSNDNLKHLNVLDIPFITRMKQNSSIYKSLINEHSHSLIHDARKIVKYNDRHLFCSKYPVSIDGFNYFAYLCIDLDKYKNEFDSYLNKIFFADHIGKEIESTIDSQILDQTNSKLDEFGRFILISNIEISSCEIIKLYYERQKIEQIFDISKNNASLLPLRGHSIEVIKGHLLISFIVTIISLLLNKRFEGTKYSSQGAFFNMKHLLINIFSSNSVVEEPTKTQNDYIRLLNLQTEYIIDLRKFTDPKLMALVGRRGTGRPTGSFGKPTEYEQASDNCVQVENNISNLLGKRPRGRPKGTLNRPEQSVETKFCPDDHTLQVKRPRGRPKGSLNKPKPGGKAKLYPDDHTQLVKRSRGRPKGSLNKPKPGGAKLSPGDHTQFVKRSRGRPKGSPNRPKQKDLTRF
jgi:hypothetical protein